MRRTADELLNVPDPAWPAIERMLASAAPAVHLLTSPEDFGRRELEALQVTARSSLGAMAAHAGGVLIDSGWVRFLGCGHAACSWSISDATRFVGDLRNAPLDGLVVGVDVLGGLFAINGGFLPDAPQGNIVYFGPDRLLWDDLGGGYSAWLESMLDPEHRSAFYADMRWPGWDIEVAALPPNTGLAIYPPLYTRESRPLSATRRSPVPLAELIAAAITTARQLDAPQQGDN